MDASPSRPGAHPLVREAVRRLDEEGLSHRAGGDGGPGGGAIAIELLVPSEQIGAAGAALARAGFAAVPPHGPRFVAYDQPSGAWGEIRLAPEPAGPRGSLHRWMRELRGAPARWLQKLRDPPGGRGFAVALMGPDGAGKSTVAVAVAARFYLPARSIYMGLYQHGRPRRRSRLPGAGMLALLLRQWARWLQGLRHRLRGRLVLFDRYTYDSRLPPDRPLPRAARARSFVLGRACPPPDLVVVLDAPAEVLYERKGEHDLDLLERHRRGLLDIHRELGPRSVLVDASADPDSVARAVTAEIWRHYVGRAG